MMVIFMKNWYDMIIYMIWTNNMAVHFVAWIHACDIIAQIQNIKVISIGITKYPLFDNPVYVKMTKFEVYNGNIHALLKNRTKT